MAPGGPVAGVCGCCSVGVAAGGNRRDGPLLGRAASSLACCVATRLRASRCFSVVVTVASPSDVVTRRRARRDGAYSRQRGSLVRCLPDSETAAAVVLGLWEFCGRRQREHRIVQSVAPGLAVFRNVGLFEQL